MNSYLFRLFFVWFALFGSSWPVHSQSDYKFSVLIANHYSNSFITEERDDELMGRYGFGIELNYHFGDRTSKFHTALGIAYARIGNSREMLWEDATPEREEQYGKFPIHYTIWDDVHYFTIPFTLHYNVATSWILSTDISLDYPIGTGYYRERSSDDAAVVEIHQDKFDSTKAYPWNTSIGWGLQFAKTFPLSNKLSFILEGKFKMYALVAARSNDYFPHEDYERPFSVGINIGILFP